MPPQRARSPGHDAPPGAVAEGFLLRLQHRSRKEPDSAMNLLGFMFEDPAKREAARSVYVGCIYFHVMGRKLEDLPVESYPDLEAVILAGWEVN